MATVDPAQKMAINCQLAALTLALVGVLMPESATAVTLEPGSEDVGRAVGEALELWRMLGADTHTPPRWPGPHTLLKPTND